MAPKWNIAPIGDWKTIDTAYLQASGFAESMDPSVRECLMKYPPWRFYTDTQIGRCIFRVLGVDASETEKLADGSPKLSLVIASLSPLQSNICVRLDKLPPEDVVMVDQWSADHIGLLENHEHGMTFACPSGFYIIQQNLNAMCEEEAPSPRSNSSCD